MDGFSVIVGMHLNLTFLRYPYYFSDDTRLEAS